jgi:hypothetical protein
MPYNTGTFQAPAAQPAAMAQFGGSDAVDEAAGGDVLTDAISSEEL